MARILATGIATLDIVNVVTDFPEEDSEIRALTQHQSRGGNATNTLVVLSQLGHHCSWAGVLIKEPDSQIIEADLQRYGIDYSFCTILSSGKMPTSYIALSQKNGSRTIIHYRDCPEYRFQAFTQLDLSTFDWFHFEGRNIEDTRQMLEFCKAHYPHIPRSVEIEKPRPQIESLFAYADLLMFSQQYVQSLGFSSATDYLQHNPTSQFATCTWGSKGAWLINKNKQLFHSPAFPPQQVIDTLGAGDTFNAGLIHSLIKNCNEQRALNFACQLAGYKCGQQGFSLANWRPPL